MRIRGVVEPKKKNWNNWNWNVSLQPSAPNGALHGKGTKEKGTLGSLVFHLKSCNTMRYDISKPTTPKMPNLGKGTECIKLLLKQTSKDMHEALISMVFPPLCARQRLGIAVPSTSL